MVNTKGWCHGSTNGGVMLTLKGGVIVTSMVVSCLTSKGGVMVTPMVVLCLTLKGGVMVTPMVVSY